MAAALIKRRLLGGDGLAWGLAQVGKNPAFFLRALLAVLIFAALLFIHRRRRQVNRPEQDLQGGQKNVQ